MANYRTALEPALRGEVDVVIHGGDVFDRPRVPASLGYQAFEPLAAVAERGVPVFIVPGNHERSRLPHARFAMHAGIRVFDRPRTFGLEIGGVRIAFAGFPFERKVRTRFPELLAQTGWQTDPAALRLLCVHQCVEGATVGPSDFTFTTAADVIRLSDIPRGIAATLSGHIHRQQVLTRDLRGRALHAPVMYPGSIERTAQAEMHERKGYMIVHIDRGQQSAGVGWEFCELPARPMIVKELRVQGLNAEQIGHAVRASIDAAPADAVLTIRVVGEVVEAALPLLTAAQLRRIAPDTMNIEIRLDSEPRIRQFRRPLHSGAMAATHHQLDLAI